MKKIWYQSILPGLLLLLISQITLSQTFTEQTGISLPVLEGGSVAWGDYDNDGDLDILLAGIGETGYISNIYRNDGGTFTDINAGLAGGCYGSAAWGDYDNDGDLDILITGESNSGTVTKIYRNDNGVFSDVNAALPPLSDSYNGGTTAGVWGDYDDDGDLDILLAGHTGAESISKIFRNDNGIFTDINAGLTGVMACSAAWGDYDNDNDLDILLTGITDSGERISKVYRNDNGSFKDINAPFPGVYLGSVAWLDYDSDGDLDILLTGYSYSGDIAKIYRNTNGIFSDIGAGLPGFDSGTVTWGDFDNDGDPDLLFSGYGASDFFTKIFRNDNGIFTDINAGLPGLVYSSSAGGDYDNDGDLDIILTGYNPNGDISEIYRNNASSPNTIPSSPSNLSYNITGIGVTLTWNRSTDIQTPQNGLSYNIYIGTAPGTVNKKSPMAMLANGYRKIVQSGFARSNSWTIKKLTAGTYYWSVQAIDNNFAGSVFPVQSSFIVPFSNSITPITDQILMISQSGPVLTVSESSTPASRQWKYSEVYGGPYDQLIAGATGTTCSATFLSAGVYYVVCESTKGGTAYLSNQVKITVTNFIEQSAIILSAVQSGNVVWGDYDNDSDLDILLTGNNESEGLVGKIYRNDAGSFVMVNAGLSGSDAGDWGDYDNDGDLDLVLIESGSSRVYRNDNGLFTDIAAGLAGVQNGSVAWGDYDNDGDLDILLTGLSSGGFPLSVIYRNDYGIFKDIGAGLADVAYSTSSWGDYDNDGDLDILLTGSKIARIYRNDDGLFTDITAGFPPISYGSGSWGDYDNDGDLDVLLTGNNLTKLYKNTNGNFTEISTSLPGISNGFTAWGDFDNDGDLDILLSGNGTDGRITKIYQNNIGVFTEFAADITGISESSVAWGDYDKDGDLDILIAGNAVTGNVSKIYKNTIITPNTAPAAPSNLQASIGANRVTLSWNKATDSKTPQPGLAYNLYIGSSPGSGGRKSAMAAIPGGFRKIVQKSLQIETWSIKNLPSGTYYWSVQAIDNSFEGSPFAPESTFTVAYSTSISPVADQTLIINQNGTILTVTEPTAADSRQWKYSMTRGGPYNQIIAGATAVTYTPRFMDWGTYYIVCESVKGGITYKSNEVKINVPVFTEVTGTGLPGIFQGSQTWGDFDNDGDPDVLITGNNISKIFRNDNGTFIDIGASLLGVLRCTASWGDYDNDGDLDILIIGSASRIYRNDAGIFTDIAAGLPGGNYGSGSWGDYDNDGDLDVLFSGNYRSLIFRNDNGIFTDINAGLTGIRMGSSAWGDYDNDGDLDVLISGNSQGGYVSIIYRNDGGFFTDIVAGLSGVIDGSIAWGDYDSDGDLDLLLTGYNNTTTSYIAKIYRNDNGTFADINAGLTGVRYSSAAWGDYDNDGDPDIFLSGLNGNAGIISKIYRNDAGVFTDINAGLPGVQYGSFAWGDYDKDGDLDFILSGQRISGYYTAIFRNNTTTVNSAPTAPSGLTPIPGSNKVTLLWNKSTDSKTPQNGLSYNIYIGTGPAQINKKSPMASLVNGYRRIFQTGTIRKNSWIVKSLPAGTYYWSVQAVDNAFAGSAFATENLFVVPFSSSAAPSASQTLAISQNGTVLTVTESAVPASRQWKYSTVSGGPYNQIIAGATGTTYTPNFSSFGTFYIVCESVYSAVSYTTNEIKIVVPVFTEQTAITLEGMRYSSASWVDYDNDGDLDIFITGYSSTGSSISKIYNNNGGVFTDINVNLPGLLYTSAAWGDYDNDGDLDILLSGYSGKDITRIYRNDAGMFTDINANLPGIEYGSASWGDYDNDGDLDVLLSGSNLANIYRNDNGIFTDIAANFVKVFRSSSAWGDYDNDGDLDVIITGLSGNDPVSGIYRNDNGFFVDIDAGLPGVSDGSVGWSDFDNDGDLDLLLSGMGTYAPVAKIFRNDNGIFADIGASLTGVFRSSVAWGDYDNDGDPDIILSGNNSSDCMTRIYRNDSGIFNDIKEPLSGVQYSSIAWGDYDKDGDLDILLTGGGSGSLANSYNAKIFRNNTLVSNSVPTAPSNLQAIQSANKVTLSWNKSTDASTPQNGLSYNLYIGTSAGLANRKSPMAVLPGGYRKIVQRGIQMNSWTVKNLASGTYYWSVQAIDNAFAGSPFAGEATFTVSYSNSVAPVADQVLSINQNGAPLTVTETSISDSRQWKYSETSGGPYDHVIAGASGTSYTPNFTSWGTYYVVCASTKSSVSYTSNEAKIIVPVFLEQKDIDLIGIFKGSAVWGDYDNDGDQDLFITGSTSSGYSSIIYRNDNGSFIDINAGLPGINYCSAAWGDCDNDGDLDLLLSGYYSGTNYLSKIYRNDSGVFTDLNAGLTGVYMGSVAWGDYDNDGDLDILLNGYVSSASYISKVYRNDNGTFTDIDAGLTGVSQGSAAWGDYDNDGDQDILITGLLLSGDKISGIYRNDNGSFININADLEGVNSGSAAWGDYDNDGDLDILLSGLTYTNEKISKIYRNDNGIFTDIAAGLQGVLNGSVDWGDFDNDGDLDILISGAGISGYISRIYRNSGGVFTDMKANLPGITTSSSAWGDYDNDGDLDIILTGSNGSDNIARIFKNTSNMPNTPPLAPANLSNTAGGAGQVILAWDKSTDTQTPQGSLTYNIQIGTAPDGYNIVSPMSSATSGYRRKPARGNTEFRNSGYIVSGLSQGTYYWRVQSLDQAYAGSAWSEAKSFTLLGIPVSGPASGIGETGFTANWNLSAGATGYHIDVATDAGFVTMVSGYNNKDAGNVTTLNITGLTPKTTYYYRVRTNNEMGTSVNSNTVNVSTLLHIPNVPTGLSASSCNDLVTLTWSAITETDFRTYRIYGGLTDNPVAGIDSTSDGIVSASTKTITGLIHGQTYFFRVKAVAASGGESQFSASVSTAVKKGVVPRIKAKWNDVLICYNINDSIATFQWYKNGAALTGATKQYYVTGKQAGSYSVTTTDKNGCINSSAR